MQRWKYFWVGCPSCGWGDILDTLMFRRRFGAFPSAPQLFWCPHCRGEPGRWPLQVVCLGHREGVEELLEKIKKAGKYSVIPRDHKYAFGLFLPAPGAERGGG